MGNKLPKEMAKDLEKQGKKVIQFIIKQKWFDQILSGEKNARVQRGEAVQREKNGAARQRGISNC